MGEHLQSMTHSGKQNFDRHTHIANALSRNVPTLDEVKRGEMASN